MGILAHGVFALKKRARMLAVVLAFAALGVALVLLNFRSRDEVVSDQNAADAENTAQYSSKNVASNGLNDWEKILPSVDAKNQDAGGGSGAGSTNQTPDTNNLTYNLTKSILESGALGAIDQNGNLTSTDFLKNINLPAGLDPDALLESAATARPKSISVTNANGPDDIRKYFNQVTAVYEKDLVPRQGRGDILVVAEVLDTRDYSKLKELDPIIEGLRRTIADIELIVVPLDYANDAVRELNYLLETKRAIEIFRNTESDPLATVVVFKRRVELLGEMAQFHRDIVTGLIAKGIATASKQ